jgi:cellulose synthase/poly-beta-1,6-N-acetylglucosamine synthase-like glycosyltransferase
MGRAAEIVFWAAAALLVWIYAGFPLVLWLRARLRPRPVRRGDVTPSVSLVIAAYNEAARIETKLRDSLALDYPADQLEILVASDGSADATDAIVAGYAARGVRLLSLPRRGKLYALDAAVAYARGDLLVFTDANTRLEPDALRLLVRSFADPAVGGVCGNQLHERPRRPDGSGRGERLYWRYDKWLKSLESRAGSIVAADGALYAIRRRLYRRPATAAATDDFAISTAVIEQGARLVYEPEARAWEATTGRAGSEFARKVRITARGWRAIFLRRALLDPMRSGFYAVVLWSHKVLRRLAPIHLLVLLGASLLTSATLPRLAAAAQLAWYALAFGGWLLRDTRLGAARPLAVPFFFVLANAAALVGLVRALRGEQIERWQPRRLVDDLPPSGAATLSLEKTGAP